MRTVRSTREVRLALRAHREAGRSVALVPTMGALHAGHLSLVDRARGLADVVVVSLFVNPAQFDEAGDLAAYPRDEAGDAVALAEAGVDVLLAPPVEAVYPPGFATTVTVTGPLAERLEGAHRGPGHFAGVCTVVTKLLVAVAPDVAVFGAKDAQQLAVVRRAVADLELPVRIEAAPTVRDADGLALSSRNARLDRAGRERALGLPRALRAAQAAVDAGTRSAAAVQDAALGELRDVELEYAEVVDPATFLPVDLVDRPVLLAVAARVGATRLIDNAVLTPREPA